jgi:hypothetical protein
MLRRPDFPLSPKTTRLHHPLTPSHYCMSTATAELASPINHVFVDFENVPKVDLTIFGSKTANFTLLLGPRQTKLDVALVEKLLAHAGSVQLVRLAAGGRNALDFTLVYYVGRAVAADPVGHFHIISKDTGYDPLVEHLRSRNIHAQRHNDFTTLPFTAPAGQPTLNPPPVTKPKSASKSKAPVFSLAPQETQVLEHLRKTTTTRPRKEKKLVSFLIAYLGHKITEAEALSIIKNLCRAGHLAIGEKGDVTYHVVGK